MQIFTMPDGSVVGPFDSIQKLPDGNYFVDGNSIIPANQVPGGVISTVPDDYLSPQQQVAATAAFNAQQKKNRFNTYTVDSDPIFFKSQRGEATKQEWLDAIAAIDAKYPYKE
jgi:hypothetical protein